MEAEERPQKIRRLSKGFVKESFSEGTGHDDAETPVVLPQVSNTGIVGIHGMSAPIVEPEVAAAERETSGLDIVAIQDTPVELDKQNSTADYTIHNFASGFINDEGDQGDADASIQAVFPNLEPEDASESPPLSKNQLKKLKRKQDWEAGRDYRRAKRKEKTKERKQRKHAASKEEENADTAPMPALASTSKDDESVIGAQQPLKRPPVHSVQLPVTVIFDCGFDDLMLDKERISLGAQLTRCYSDNHRALFQFHMVISSFGGKLKERFDTVLSGHHQSWKGVEFLNEDFVEAAEQAQEWMVGPRGGTLAGAFTGKGSDAEDAGETETVYLTSDSPDTLTELKPYSTYIIGGLVDRNRHKGICYKRAMDRGMKTARLPIGEYMQMNSRFVLATNHVSEIMVKWLELRDWGEAFLQVVPKRKGGVLKGVGAAVGEENVEERAAGDAGVPGDELKYAG